MSLEALFPTIDASLPLAAGGSLSAADDFEVLGLALEAAGLTDTVAGLNGVTLFAPTDAAFADLAGSLGFTGDAEDASAVFGHIAGALTGLSEDGNPIPLLTDILLYHVAPTDNEQAELSNAGPQGTLLDGATVQVTGDTIVDADPDATNASIVAADVAAGANTVQAIDQVLLPLDAPVDDADPTLLGILEESGGAFDTDGTDFDMLLQALQATGLDGAVDDPEAELTVFVPNDAAFLSLAADLGYDGDDEGEAFQTILDAAEEADPENPLALVTDILTYHVSPGEQDAEAVLGSDTLVTLQGGTIGVDGTTLVDADPDNADASIIATDISASNGIAHVIDEVMLPADVAAADDDPDTPAEPEEDDGGGFGEIFFALGFLGLFVGAFAGFA